MTGLTDATTPWLFIPVSGVIAANDVSEYSIDFEIQNPGSLVRVQRSYQTSDDGVSWSTVSAGGIVNAEGWHWGAAWLAPNAARFYRFGVRVANVSGAEVNSLQLLVRVRYRLV